MIIREAVVDDVYRGLLDCLNVLRPTGLTPIEAILVFKERARNPLLKTYVAIEEKYGHIVGTATALMEPKFINFGRIACHIEDVAVLEKAQGEGVGQALMNHAIQQAGAMGAYKVILDCNEQLLSFYNRFGFTSNDGCYHLRLNLESDDDQEEFSRKQSDR